MLQNIKKVSFAGVVIFLSACAQLPTNFEAPHSYVIEDTENTLLGKEAKESPGGNNKHSRMFLIGDGIDAFVARAALMASAEKTIDVQYYIWHSDLTGKLLFNGLIVAADRGVRVRILLDDFPIESKTESLLYAMDQHENIEVRLFNPMANRSLRVADYLLSFQRINRRMHNKSLTVDNQYTIVGGRNIGDEYFSAHKEGNYGDLDVLTTGPVVREVGAQFDLYWNSEVVYPVTAFNHNKSTKNELTVFRKELSDLALTTEGSKYHLDIKDSEAYQSIIKGRPLQDKKSLFFDGEAHVIYDDPLKALGESAKEVSHLAPQFELYVDKMDKSFEIISPYFVPGKAGVSYLTGLVKEGIKVRVLTNSLSSTDGLPAQSGYSRRRYDLLEGGVELYETKARIKTNKTLRHSQNAQNALHAKVFIFDREQVFIGSLNFDPRSEDINSEIGLILDVPQMANLIAQKAFDESTNDTAYKVKIANERLDIEGVDINRGDVYWIETKDGKQTYYATEPKTSFWRRFGQGFFSIMPIESQL